MNKQKNNTLTLAYGAVLTALIFVLQLVGASIRFGTFSISLVLIPIVLGAALCGKNIGAWLGLMFGVAVLISGDAALFYTINPIGTIITVLLKGAACGYVAGLIYDLLCKKNKWLATFGSALICPVVNTGVFLIGCLVFFYPTMVQWAQGDFGGNAITYMFVGLVGINFLLELAVNLLICPLLVRLIHIVEKQFM